MKSYSPVRRRCFRFFDQLYMGLFLFAPACFLRETVRSLARFNHRGTINVSPWIQWKWIRVPSSLMTYPVRMPQAKEVTSLMKTIFLKCFRTKFSGYTNSSYIKSVLGVNPLSFVIKLLEVRLKVNAKWLVT